MTEHESKSTSAQVTKYAELSMQCPVSWGKQHCACNEVEHGGGGVTNKCFTSAELLYKHSWRRQIRNSALQGHMFLHEMNKVSEDVYLTEDKLPPDAFWFCGPQFGEIFLQHGSGSQAIANSCFGDISVQRRHNTTFSLFSTTDHCFSASHTLSLHCLELWIINLNIWHLVKASSADNL